MKLVIVFSDDVQLSPDIALSFISFASEIEHSEIIKEVALYDS